MSIQEAWSALRHEPRVRLLADLARPRRLFLVGGCLRDAALGIPAKDLDLTVERDAAAIAERFGKDGQATVVHLGGERFAAIRLVDSTGTIDLLGLDGTTLDEDLRRRDFTVNAMAVDVESGEIHDPAGGLADLELRRLRATRGTVFAEDPLRALRLARLLLTLPGFTVEAETEELARRAVPSLAGIAKERIRDELDRAFTHPDLGGAIRIFDRLGLLRHLFGDEPRQRSPQAVFPAPPLLRRASRQRRSRRRSSDSPFTGPFSPPSQAHRRRARGPSSTRLTGRVFCREPPSNRPDPSSLRDGRPLQTPSPGGSGCTKQDLDGGMRSGFARL